MSIIGPNRLGLLRDECRRSLSQAYAGLAIKKDLDAFSSFTLQIQNCKNLSLFETVYRHSALLS